MFFYCKWGILLLLISFNVWADNHWTVYQETALKAYEQNECFKAIALQKQALKLAESQLPENSPILKNILLYLAYYYLCVDDYEKAIPIHARALDLY